MTGSQILFAVPVLLGLVVAAVVVYAQRRDGHPMPWRGVAGVLAVSVLLGTGSSLLDRSVAEETLVEFVVPGPAAGGATEHSWSIAVEHPTAHHELDIHPDGVGRGRPPVVLGVRLTDATGAVVVDETEALEGSRSSRRGGGWDSYSHGFVPSGGGPLVLTVTVAGPDVESLRFRISDEDRTDGGRIPGY